MGGSMRLLGGCGGGRSFIMARKAGGQQSLEGRTGRSTCPMFWVRCKRHREGTSASLFTCQVTTHSSPTELGTVHSAQFTPSSFYSNPSFSLTVKRAPWGRCFLLLTATMILPSIRAEERDGHSQIIKVLSPVQRRTR